MKNTLLALTLLGSAFTVSAESEIISKHTYAFVVADEAKGWCELATQTEFDLVNAEQGVIAQTAWKEFEGKKDYRRVAYFEGTDSPVNFDENKPVEIFYYNRYGEKTSHLTLEPYKGYWAAEANIYSFMKTNQHDGIDWTVKQGLKELEHEMSGYKGLRTQLGVYQECVNQYVKGGENGA